MQCPKAEHWGGRRTGGFGSNTFENIIDERVQDRHSLVRDTSIGVDLLED